jgi:hypothetical protein
MKWDNVEGELRFQMLKSEQYIAKLRKAIDKIYAASNVSATSLVSGAAAVAATIRLFPVTPNDVLSLFICAQTVDTLKKIIKKLVAADCPPIYSYIRGFFSLEGLVEAGIAESFVVNGKLRTLEEYRKFGNRSPKENQICAVYY